MSAKGAPFAMGVRVTRASIGESSRHKPSADDARLTTAAAEALAAQMLVVAP